MFFYEKMASEVSVEGFLGVFVKVKYWQITHFDLHSHLLKQKLHTFDESVQSHNDIFYINLPEV